MALMMTLIMMTLPVVNEPKIKFKAEKTNLNSGTNGPNMTKCVQRRVSRRD
jgi:hypothetical protein